jgi:predicted TIM-barrel fold metal-dependent hydrolase
LIRDTFVFDGVVHVADLSFDHMKVRPTPEQVEAILDRTKRLLGGLIDQRMGDDISEEAKGTPSANYDVIFGNAPTDMAAVGSLPFFGTANNYINADHPLMVNYGLAKAYPERCVFVGGIEPLGVPGEEVLASLDYQVNELGAQSMKFYPLNWCADDRELAYPLYERCGELGINVLQFHLCRPADALHDVETQRPNYLQRVARDFPDMTLVMHHPEPLYFEETVNILARFPNIRLLLTPMIQMGVWRPRLVQKMMGELLQQVGSHKLMYGSEGALAGNPTRYIESVLDFEIPDDLRRGYGYPQITDEDKKRILGLNSAALFGIDVEQKLKELGAAAG